MSLNPHQCNFDLLVEFPGVFSLATFSKDLMGLSWILVTRHERALHLLCIYFQPNLLTSVWYSYCVFFMIFIFPPSKLISTQVNRWCVHFVSFLIPLCFIGPLVAYPKARLKSNDDILSYFRPFGNLLCHKERTSTPQQDISCYVSTLYSIPWKENLARRSLRRISIRHSCPMTV